MAVSFPGFKLKLCLIFIACLIGITSAQLSAKFYNAKCPKALTIIRKTVEDAVRNESRMGASLLRLHFHDCFVQGCDASVLLDDTANFTGEKTAFPNANSLRGFKVIDDIKSKLEAKNMCPGVVSCADILTVAARDAAAALGAQRWDIELGRRDSTTASLSGANSDLPGPSLNLSDLIAAFDKKNFTTEEMVTLSGAHTIGLVRCKFFRKRIYNESNIDPTFATKMQAECPLDSSGDDNLSPFDSSTPFKFDNEFYKNLIQLKGLVHSDQELFTGPTNSQVRRYSRGMGNFKKDFANAMSKMTRLSPLTGSDGEIRKNCRFINSPTTTQS